MNNRVYIQLRDLPESKAGTKWIKGGIVVYNG